MSDDTVGHYYGTVSHSNRRITSVSAQLDKPVDSKEPRPFVWITVEGKRPSTP
jgi:hypothetical protein